jgi:hypothetical protein
MVKKTHTWHCECSNLKFHQIPLVDHFQLGPSDRCAPWKTSVEEIEAQNARDFNSCGDRNHYGLVTA